MRPASLTFHVKHDARCKMRRRGISLGVRHR
jgi:hypothetical protein